MLFVQRELSHTRIGYYTISATTVKMLAPYFFHKLYYFHYATFYNTRSHKKATITL